MRNKSIITVLSIAIICSLSDLQTNAQEKDDKNVITLTLNQCIELTLKNHKSRIVSDYVVKAAEAQIKQAKSGNLPTIDLTAGYTLMDEDPNFVQPEMNIQVPSINLGTYTVSLGTFTVPSQNIKLADKQTGTASVEVMYPLFTGGKISSYISQAEAALEIAKSESKGNDQQIIFETKKLYYATLLAIRLEGIANEAYERFKSTLKFTEAVYQNGSGKVTRSDYLKNKTVTEAIKTVLIQIAGERKNAQAALVHAMGLNWQTQIQILEKDFPPIKEKEDLGKLIDQALEQNPMFTKIDNALKVYEAKIDIAKSELYPSIALFGSYRRLFNSYDYGVMTKENKNMWIIGLGMQMNIFNGFKSIGMINESKANYEKLNLQRELLKNGIALKVQYLFNRLQSSKEKETAAKDAMLSASEDRDLVEKAYFSDIMELKDLIQAQVTESMMKAQYETISYECSEVEAEMDLVLASNNTF
jgi:outer membrane protein